MKLKEALLKVDWSTVCTVASCAGTVCTGVLAGVGGARMSKEWDRNLPKGKKFKIFLKHQWPALLVGGLTIGLDILGHHIDKATIAKLTAAVGAASVQLKDYREEVASEYGPEAERDISERLNKKWTDEGVAYHLDELQHTFVEETTGIAFTQSTSMLYEAVNSINLRLIEDSYYEGRASVADFLTLCDCTESRTKYSENVIWYAPYIETHGGLPLVGFYLEPKADPMGKRYWIIHWKPGCEPRPVRELVDMQIEDIERSISNE